MAFEGFNKGYGEVAGRLGGKTSEKKPVDENNASGVVLGGVEKAAQSSPETAGQLANCDEIFIREGLEKGIDSTMKEVQEAITKLIEKKELADAILGDSELEKGILEKNIGESFDLEIKIKELETAADVFRNWKAAGMSIAA
jgi:hypothetical protein